MANPKDVARAIQVSNSAGVPIKSPPQMPETLLIRFPEMRQWQQKFNTWATEHLSLVINGPP
jgi:hypothetical protein